MAANTLNLTAVDSGKAYPLRGDMDVSLNFTPSTTFDAMFATYSNGSFTFTSTTAQFRQLDGTLANTLTVGGKVALWFNLMYNDSENTWDIIGHNLGSGEGGGGGGTATSGGPEVQLSPDVDGNLTIDKSQGYNFAVTLARNVKFLNPVGYSAGDKIQVIVKQDASGGHVAGFDTLYAVPNAQPPVLSSGALVMDKFEFDATGAGEFLVTPYINAYSVITALASNGTTLYFMMGGAAGTGALNKILDGETVYIIRNGKGAEVTGSVVGDQTNINELYNGAAGRPSYVIAGKPVNGGRPTLQLLPENRPAFGKALINIEGTLTVEIRDLILTGARNADGDARGIAPNTYAPHVIVKNVEITNCNNGMLWGNESFHGRVELYDCNFDGNGIGSPNSSASEGFSSAGYTHNLYAGHNETTWTAARSSFINSVSGHNLKSRAGMMILDQVLTHNSHSGRELNMPNGGGVRATNCHFWKTADAIQGNLCGIGEETVDTSRVREYTFTNCRFQNDIQGGGKDVTFFISFDRQYKLTFIDCEFIGDTALSLQADPNGSSVYVGMTTVNGIRYYPEAAPDFIFTGGPIGPILPVGYFPVPMTP